MLTNPVWQSSGLTPDGGQLCIGCVEERLGRQLTNKDFADVPLNWNTRMSRSARLQSRLEGGPPIMFAGIRDWFDEKVARGRTERTLDAMWRAAGDPSEPGNRQAEEQARLAEEDRPVASWKDFARGWFAERQERQEQERREAREDLERFGSDLEMLEIAEALTQKDKDAEVERWQDQKEVDHYEAQVAQGFREAELAEPEIER